MNRIRKRRLLGPSAAHADAAGRLDRRAEGGSETVLLLSPRDSVNRPALCYDGCMSTRAALVGDQKWIEWWTHLGGPLTPAEEKHFPEGQLAAACEWACA